MEWWEFFENYPRWTASAVRTKITRLQSMGTAEEVVIAVRHLADNRCKAQLIRTALDWGVRFTPEQVAQLEAALPPELQVRLREWTGQPEWQPWETL